MAVVKQRIPLWIATPITVAVATPFATRLGTWGLPVWISFIVWAEYFVLGANMEALKMIGYGFLYGCLMTGFWLASSVALTSAMNFDIAFIITNFIWIGLIVYSFKNPSIGKAVLPIFNGVSMTLAVYFTGALPPVEVGTYTATFVAAFWTLIAGYFGAFLGWFNVTITFPYTAEE
ncbi:MAG: DUF1097 family protein [Candidatus Baldrarchaeota archaeon]